MSRLIVKNLPDKITEDRLREQFNSKGQVTDVQLKYTKDGRFRHFAFIGFQNEEEAKAAKDYFNMSYLDSRRIAVECCVELGDQNKPRSWSRYAKDSTAYQKEHKTDTKVPKEIKKEKKKKISPELLEMLNKHKDDPSFLEYLEVHGLTKESWENALNMDSEKDNSLSNDIEEEEEKDKLAANECISDLDYLKVKTKQKELNEVDVKKIMQKNYHTLILRGIPYKIKKVDIKQFFKPIKVDSIRIPKIKGIVYVGFKNEEVAERAISNKNRSFINGNRIIIQRLKNLEEKNENTADENRYNEKWERQEKSMKIDEDIAESGRIFARNLPYTTTEEELQSLFEKFGPISEILVPLDKSTRKVKGYAIITFVMPEHAVKAYTELDGTIFHGRMLHLLPGKPKEIQQLEHDEGTSYKTKKMMKLKTEANSSHNWNTLFLGHNTVADVLASDFNISKQEILSGDNAAVRLALGETQLVNETKEFLIKSGVKLDAFNQNVSKRSKTTILVKNLPAKTTSAEIRDLFVKFGFIGRVLLPPSGITAIVEFIEPSEARTAFRHLAYSKFKNLPLYLEWAPEDTFDATVNPIEEPATENHEKVEESDDDVDPEPDTTLYIKNLNFETTEETVKKHFKECGKIASVSISRKKDLSRPNMLLSMGYGFIQFYKQESLNNALKKLQGSLLDGHHIELKRSNRTVADDKKVIRKSNNVSKQTGCKILVRNIPFQANESEIRQLFETFGIIKALRLPRKMVGTGTHRGFAFVEYNSKADAKRAMESFCQSTHLYGRRLVLEWAQLDDTVEELRKRTADHFVETSEAKNMKSVANVEVSDEEE